MNTLDKITIKRNYNLKGINYDYYPKTRGELVNIINTLIEKYNTSTVDLNTINVSIIKNFNYCFKALKINFDISEWDVSNGQNFKYMFFGCKSFTADLSNWNVSKAKYYDSFAKNSGLFKYLERYPERIPERFRGNYL